MSVLDGIVRICWARLHRNNFLEDVWLEEELVEVRGRPAPLATVWPRILMPFCEAKARKFLQGVPSVPRQLSLNNITWFCNKKTAAPANILSEH